MKDPSPQEPLKLLMSFHYGRTANLEKMIERADGWPVEVFVDSGAFSVKHQGAEINLVDYVAFLKRWQPYITAAASLDVIGDARGSWDNLRRMEDAGISALPVFHTGSSWEWLDMIIDAGYRYMAFGGLIRRDRKALTRWLRHAMRITAEAGVAIHGFAQTTVPFMEGFGWYSVDSTTWLMGSRVGSLFHVHRNGRIWREYNVVGRSGKPDHARWKRQAAIIRRAGFDPVKTYHGDSFDYHEAVAYSAYSWSVYEQRILRAHDTPGPHGPGTRLYFAGVNNEQSHYFDDALRGVRHAHRSLQETR